MPCLAPDANPKYRLHKHSGQAIVTLSGRDHYLGPHGSAASHRRYDCLIAEWIAGGRLALVEASDRVIVEVMAAYKRFAKEYYASSGEYENMLRALQPLKESYGRLPVADFSPLKLKAVRQKLIDSGLCRNEVNQRIGRIKRFFAWGVENELIPSGVLHGLKSVKGLARGRSEARESEPIKPVPDAFVDAIRTKVSPHVWAMIELQRFTGMRPGEVVVMRTCDIDASGQVWVYSPSRHKNAWRGHQRKIYLGPRAQAVLKPWLRRELEAPIFQPREAEGWHREQRRLARATPLSCGNKPGTNRKPNAKRRPGDWYTPRTYYVAIRRACIATDVPDWSPNQLRHNAATWLRKEFGLDVARAILGHRSPRVTETYAELDEGKAAAVMGQVG